jgi:hypothetical protein
MTELSLSDFSSYQSALPSVVPSHISSTGDNGQFILAAVENVALQPSVYGPENCQIDHRTISVLGRRSRDLQTKLQPDFVLRATTP